MEWGIGCCWVVAVSQDLKLVFVSPVSRPQKDRNQTGPRLEKTRPAVQSFDF